MRGPLARLASVAWFLLLFLALPQIGAAQVAVSDDVSLQPGQAGSITLDLTHFFDAGVWKRWNGHIICDSGCGGAASFNDNTAFTFGTTAINLSGFVVDDTATNAVTENSAGAPRMSTNRIAYAELATGATLYDARLIRALTSTDVVTANAGTGNFNVVGTKSNNAGVPGATNVGALVGVATAAVPTYIEGNQVAVSVDLSGNLRIAGGGGTSQADNTVLGNITGGGALFDATPPAITDGNVGIPRMDTNRALHVNCQSGCGSVTDITATGSLVAIGSVTTTTLNGAATTSLYLFGTWVATVQFEGSTDGTNYYSLNGLPVTGGALVTSTTANGQAWRECARAVI